MAEKNGSQLGLVLGNIYNMGVSCGVDRAVAMASSVVVLWTD